MRSALHHLPTATLRSLADALRSGRLQAPVTLTSLSRVGVCNVPVAVVSELEAVFARGAGAAAMAWGIELLVAEREARLASRPELVWTGPEANGSGSRDTSVVVAELFGGAERSVLVATYAIHRGAEVFKVLVG